MTDNFTVLGIETSCDETAVAIYTANDGLVAHEVYSQVATHQLYGGVVPELASRDHVKKLLPLVKACLQKASLDKSKLNAIAYTRGPGLLPALMVGATFAKSMAFALDIPSIGVHHMEGHLMAAFLDKNNSAAFPFLALLVSGGHTMIVQVNGLGDYELIGETLDDAAGEAFDKTAKLLGLPQPGGPHLAALAERGNPNHFQFPRPMLKHPGCDFSFSGLKTAVVTCVAKYGTSEQTKADIAAAFEEAVIDTLVRKCRRAIEQTGLNDLVIVGGVSANKKLRQQFVEQLQTTKVCYPALEFCTDNGAMIAYLGYLRLTAMATLPASHLDIDAVARWPITTISA